MGDVVDTEAGGGAVGGGGGILRAVGAAAWGFTVADGARAVGVAGLHGAAELVLFVS